MNLTRKISYERPHHQQQSRDPMVGDISDRRPSKSSTRRGSKTCRRDSNSGFEDDGLAPPAPPLRTTRSSTHSISTWSHSNHQHSRSGGAAVTLNLSEIPFTGRRVEMKFIQKHYKDCLEGSVSKGVLLYGDSGCGKTSLVKEFASRNHQACCISTKFSESRSPFSAITEAFQQLCDELVKKERKEEIDILNETLDDDDIKVFLDFDPRFHSLLKQSGKKKKQVEPSNRFLNSNKHNQDWLVTRMQKVIRLSIHTVATPKFPVILFLDDMHQVDADSCLMIRNIMNGGPGFFLMGCFRNMTDEIRRILEVEDCVSCFLDGLAERDVNDMIASVIHRDAVETEELSSVVWKKTAGNPFWISQFLQLLQDNESLRYSFDTYKWVWDLRRIATETNLTSNVVEIITRKIQKLPLRTQEALKVASCLGSQFDIDLLTTIVASHHEMSKRKIKLSDGRMTFVSDEAIRVMKVDLLKSLQVAVKLLLLEVHHDSGGETIYKFAHDRIRIAIYSLLPDGEERDGLHLLIGKLLYKMNAGGKGEEWMLMVATGQMNKAVHLIQERKAQIKLAELNLQAAQGAVSKSAFFLASEYLKSGIRLLRESEDPWTDTYRLMLESSSTLAEIQYIKGEHEACNTLVDEILHHGQTLKDRLRASLTKIELYGSKEDFDAAMKLGYSLLEHLDIKINQNSTSYAVNREFKKINKLMKGRSDEDLLMYPPARKEEVVVGMKIMSLIAGYAYFSGRTADLSMLGFRMMNLTVTSGLTDCSCHAFALYGVVLASVGEYKKGYRFGSLALSAFEMAQSNEYLARTFLIVHSFLNHLCKPFHQSLGPLMDAHQTGMDTGDTEYGLLASTSYVGMYMFCGLQLEPLYDDIKNFQATSASYNQSTTQTLLNISCQCVEGLMGKRGNPTEIDACTISGNTVALRYVWLLKMMMAYFFHDVDRAMEYADKFAALPKDTGGTSYEFTAKMLFRCLANLSRARITNKSRYKSAADKLIKSLEQATKDGNLNCHHLLCLCYAEKASLKKAKEASKVKELFDNAILAASKTGFTQISALANERAGIFFHTIGDAEYGKSYLSRAMQLYSLWGAKAKVNHLISNFPFLQNTMEVNETTGHLARKRFSRNFVERHRDVQQAVVARNTDGTNPLPENMGLRQKGKVVRSLFTRRNSIENENELF